MTAQMSVQQPVHHPDQTAPVKRKLCTELSSSSLSTNISLKTGKVYENITKKKAKHAVVDSTFNLLSFGLDVVVRVWIPKGQTQKRHKRSYICMEGIIHNEIIRFDSHQHFMKALRQKFHIKNAFDIGQYIDKNRKTICGKLYHTNQYAETPVSILNFLKNDLNLKLSSYDPCPVAPTVDGLAPSTSWMAQKNETVFINPPFKDTLSWCQKLIQEFKKGSLHHACLLLPARFSSPWISMLLNSAEAPGIASRIIVPKSVTFQNYNSKIPFGAMLVFCDRDRLNGIKSASTTHGTTITYLNRDFK
tara:strand:- start:2918 stop:3829 length:912 start_codon:yes stop_codon:yes gene_type:complete